MYLQCRPLGSLYFISYSWIIQEWLLRKLLWFSWELFDSLNNVPSKMFVLEIPSLDFIETPFFWFITEMITVVSYWHSGIWQHLQRLFILKAMSAFIRRMSLKTNIVNIIVHMMPYRRLHLPFQGDVTKLLDKKKSLQDLAELPLIYPLTVMLVLMPI